MESYKLALEALHYLLSKTGASFWAKWIETDIKLAEENTVDHHLSAYGGMGSLNDVVICVLNNHAITKEQELWVNYLFQDLKGLCFTTARTPVNRVMIEKSLWDQPKEIQGWRCLSCGYGKLSKSDIENFIAPKLLREMVLKAFEEKRLSDCVEQVLSLNIPGRNEEYESIKQIALRSGLLVDDDAGLRPCPNCNSDNTAVYRWVIRKVPFCKEKLVPFENNLEMKKI
jgi:hypothetical protein